ncbi:hypothetical protein H4R33_001076 [Dimargaris cristalligena]|uniref:Uncharacterized protein n=1 Tax=Dimargaris cristalligena TaxID=215637 RepID=A0A4P9ZW50_9FUNG|nr:hypothetical protein H4R33_001076 [Dimargaris cristalligena]RKP37082.1 hypothetical protein BJ085DRAFT_36273 [Dimargaris cristalligena]|eukprot:RKP37082.1 hypothetical protein BJ085DRAFT_36273 [Dimargaris cristalligena]
MDTPKRKFTSLVAGYSSDEDDHSSNDGSDSSLNTPSTKPGSDSTVPTKKLKSSLNSVKPTVAHPYPPSPSHSTATPSRPDTTTEPNSAPPLPQVLDDDEVEWLERQERELASQQQLYRTIEHLKGFRQGQAPKPSDTMAVDVPPARPNPTSSMLSNEHVSKPPNEGSSDDSDSESYIDETVDWRTLDIS